MTHPYEEGREMKALKDDIDMLSFVADAECGGENHQQGNDGFHFRQPWVLGVQEEVQMLRKHVDVMAAEIAELKYKLTRPNPNSP
ncbi:unnamed protein product [Brassica rapa]|uniref:Uncharacterized protein n=1 Tax=Brassica campestris TaxID=3711 RepID=A0A8D9D8R8_BRACM|nr:unnamed protein product [Brassica rapa]